MFCHPFDESFNEELEKEQMDFIVRYFKMVKLKVDTCHLDFRAYNSKRFEKSIWGMCWEVGLEKPHSDIYGWTKRQLENARLDCRRQELKWEDRNLLDVGSCSLHVSMEHLELVWSKQAGE